MGIIEDWRRIGRRVFKRIMSLKDGINRKEIGIEKRMKIDEKIMRIRNNEFKRIKERIIEKKEGEIGRKRKDRGLIKRIRSGRKMKDERIDKKILREIKYGKKIDFMRDEKI